MKGVCVKFYMYEAEKHRGILLYEWLLEFAKKNGIPGGSAFRGIAGYGRSGVLHEEHFFELASNVPMVVDFVLSEDEMEIFLNLVKKEEVRLFYTVTEIVYNVM